MRPCPEGLQMAAHHLNFNLETVEMMRFQLGTFWSVDQFSVAVQSSQSFAESMSKRLPPSHSCPECTSYLIPGTLWGQFFFSSHRNYNGGSQVFLMLL